MTWVTGEIVTSSIMNVDVRDNENALRDVLQGSVADANLQHQQPSGALSARPAPGKAGRSYYATDLGVTLLDDGTEWQVVGYAPQKCEYFGDDLVQGRALNWDSATGGSGTVTDSAQDFGAVLLDSGITNDSFALIRPKNLGHMLASKIFLLVVRFRLEQPASAGQGTAIGVSVGFPGDTTDPADGIYFRKTSSGNVFGVARASSVETTQDMGVNGSTLGTYIAERLSASLLVYLNTFNAAGLKGTITTNLPTVRVFAGARLANTTGGARQALVDSYHLWVQR